MCGIAGLYGFPGTSRDAEDLMRRMLALIRHRGPDEFGIYVDEEAALGNTRLSIIDLENGQQPISNEDQTLWIVLNGEIFNYRELRKELQARGHRFATQTDTEVFLHLYEDLGPRCLARLNGQFAVAIWDSRRQQLFLARDRLGIRPLYYAQMPHGLVFASEVKAILADPRVHPELDPVSLNQTFTYWSPLSPRTAFRGIVQIPPGHYLLADERHTAIERYWELDFPGESGSRPAVITRQLQEDVEELHALLADATRIRLRADVPVGAYLSGGLDSSVIAALARATRAPLETFSISFCDEKFDESSFQLEMARFLGTRHHVVHASHADIGQAFPDAVWHAETPILRTAPVPMLLLSRLVRGHNFKVVLTGEGADEFLGGYDIFKEAAVRRFWARQPDSRLRPLLLGRLYPDIFNQANFHVAYIAAFFGQKLKDSGDPFFSHAIRWQNSARNSRFFSAEVEAAISRENSAGQTTPCLPAAFTQWGPLERAQFLEISIFLSQYLLSSQGDRMAMANGVEGRFPFLDHRVVDFCTRLTSRRKLNGLQEKYALRMMAESLLPDRIAERRKRPYRAPIYRSFFSPAPDYLADVLSERRIADAGLFKARAVGRLIRKLEQGIPAGETEDMALAGILSAQLLHQQFVSEFRIPAPLGPADKLKICRGRAMAGHSRLIA